MQQGSMHITATTCAQCPLKSAMCCPLPLSHLHVACEELGPGVGGVCSCLVQLVHPPAVTGQVLAVLAVHCADLTLHAIGWR